MIAINVFNTDLSLLLAQKYRFDTFSLRTWKKFIACSTLERQANEKSSNITHVSVLSKYSLPRTTPAAYWHATTTSSNRSHTSLNLYTLPQLMSVRMVSSDVAMRVQQQSDRNNADSSTKGQSQRQWSSERKWVFKQNVGQQIRCCQEDQNALKQHKHTSRALNFEQDRRKTTKSKKNSHIRWAYRWESDDWADDSGLHCFSGINVCAHGQGGN